MQNKKVVFFLLLILVSSALSTLVYHKYMKEPSSLDKAFNLLEDHKAIDLLKGHETCVIQAGLSLKFKPLESGQFQLTSLEGLPEVLKKELEVGDLIVGRGFVASGEEVGKTKELTIIKNLTGQVKTLPYIVQAYSNCF